MTIERKDWNYDNSGTAVVPASSSSIEQQVLKEMQTGDGRPSPETQRALAESAPPVPAVTPVRDAKGNIIRPDWSKPTPTVYQKPEGNVTRPDWSKPRNEAGEFIGKSEAELRSVWEREGGVSAVAQRVLATESAIVSLSDNPAALQAAINELPKEIALKAVEVFRLSPPGFNREDTRIGQFLDSLSESEFQELHKWFSKLSRNDQDAILAGLSK
jgi:hypothetical protein